MKCVLTDLVCVQFGSTRPELYQKSNRSSHSSDTSSAYSGSDTMTSVHSSADAEEVDLTGLVESIVDSDEEEDLAESMDVSKHSQKKIFFFNWEEKIFLRLLKIF